jgi:MarR family 2-MHQ and catechol resistance regulon transcriptional repressor
MDLRERFYEGSMRELAAAMPQFGAEFAELSLNLAFTYDVQHSFLSKKMCRFGLAKSSFNLLLLLRHGPGKGMQLSEIGDLLITSRANITGLVDHLERKGYVKRVVDTHDRRARLARITKRGETLIEKVIPHHNRECSLLMGHLTPAERQTLLELLKKVRRSPALVAEAEDSELAPVGVNED